MYGGRCLVAPCDSFRHGRSKWQREVEHLGCNLLRSWHLESYAGPCRKPVRACIQARTGWSDEGQRDNCLQQWGQAEQPCGVSWPLGHLVQLWFTASAYPSFGCWWQDSRLLEFCIEAHREEMIKTYKTSAFFLSAFFLRYEMHDKIIITRQIVIGGRNRYLLNSHNVQQNQIQNLLLEYHYDSWLPNKHAGQRMSFWCFMAWAPASAEVSFGVAECEQSPFPDHAGQDHQGHQHEATGNSEYDWRGSRHAHVWEQESRGPQDLGKEAKQGSASGKWVRRGETGCRRVKIFPVHLWAIPAWFHEGSSLYWSSNIGVQRRLFHHFSPALCGKLRWMRLIGCWVRRSLQH